MMFHALSLLAPLAPQYAAANLLRWLLTDTVTAELHVSILGKDAK